MVALVECDRVVKKKRERRRAMHLRDTILDRAEDSLKKVEKTTEDGRRGHYVWRRVRLQGGREKHPSVIERIVEQSMATRFRSASEGGKAYAASSMFGPQETCHVVV